MRANKPKALGVYACSFDPLTIGHVWMIRQGGMRNIHGDLDPGVCTVFLMPPREIAASLQRED
jgi:phosphopantetheine adenylyltransferase